MEIYHENNTQVKMHMRPFAFTGQAKYFHWHKALEVVQPLHGALEVFIDGLWYTAKENDIVIIREKSIHAFCAADGIAEGRLGWFPLSVLLNAGVIPTPVKQIITAEEIAAYPELPQLIHSILSLIQSEPIVLHADSNPMVQSLYAAFYFSLMRYFPAAPADKRITKEKQEFYQIVEYVNAHFTEHLTVQTAAQALFMDRGKLSGLFSKYADMPLNAYINMLRLDRANQLIRDGAGITEAALESGFQSVRTFNDVYKKTTGTTPSARSEQNCNQ